MSWYRRGRFALDAFRSNSTRIIPKAPSREPSFRVLQSGLPDFAARKAEYWGFSSYYSISRKLGVEVGINRSLYSPFLNGGRRLYYVDHHQVHHFRPRGPQRWFQNPRNLLIVVLAGSGVFVTVYFGNLETVPYTKRSHLVLLSRSMERKLGENQFEQLKGSFKGKILPALHPVSVRVRLISKDIIDALGRGLRQENVWSDLGYASEGAIGFSEASKRETIMALTDDGQKAEDKWSREDEILDDKWVQQSRKKGQDRGAQVASSHLDQLNWEVLVVDEPILNAVCFPGGKIVIFTGLFQHFRTDEEIATIIAHEVGHAVARHVAEQITKNMWFAILQLVLYQFVMPDVVNTMSALLLRLPFSRRMEMEADYIGLLLMASAGYDPRAAPGVYQKLFKITGDLRLSDYLSTHPSGEKRAQILGQAKVMEEALSMYREVRAGRGAEGFL